ncbi:hypothetical protein [Heyndrickxia sporothermodurans]|uniref:hypothetical protein n=1 Tax=Heyndrickxia sporothermodurans TaxID=46224 RepID=UPI0035DB485A
MSEKKPRLSLTANKMPEDIYNILAEKGDSRRLTPYVVSLVEKERMMDALVMNLPKLLEKIDHLEDKIDKLNAKIEGSEVSFSKNYSIPKNTEEVEQGELGISEKIDSEIDEEIIEVDF